MRASHMSGVALPATLIFLFVTSTVAQAFQAVDEFEKEPIPLQARHRRKIAFLL
ncbi:MAG: hypothetical protein U0936_26705 [Planctomycetaceae bacterium]